MYMYLVCIYTCTCHCHEIHVLMHQYIHVLRHTYMYQCIRMYMYVFTCTYQYTCIPMYMYTNVHVQCTPSIIVSVYIPQIWQWAVPGSCQTCGSNLWTPLLSSATLQQIPGHEEALTRWDLPPEEKRRCRSNASLDHVRFAILTVHFSPFCRHGCVWSEDHVCSDIYK